MPKHLTETGKNRGALRRASNYNVFILEIILVILALLFLYPLIYMAITSLKPQNEIFRHLELPSRVYFDNYIAVFKNGNFFASMLNTIIIVFASLVSGIAVTSMASYPISRSGNKIIRNLYFFFLLGMMVPFQANMITVFKLILHSHLMNTRTSVILLNIAGMIPFSIMVYAGFIKSVPYELEESAKIDGCKYFRLFWNIVFPLLKPATITVVVANIFAMWNDFFTPFLFIHAQEKKPLMTMVYQFQGERSSDWGAIFALCTVSVLPLMFIFLVFQKQFYKGIVAGAVKE